MNIRLAYIGSFCFAALAGLLAGCSSPAPNASPPTTTPTATSTPAAASLVAKISEIQKLPVFVRLLSATQEQPAKEGMGLQTGETIRTQGQALAQVDFNNGLAFRIAGDAVLKLQPDNRLNLTGGEMITWVQPGKKIPTEIITPVGVAGIRGTTVFVKIPKDPQEGVLFFAWEGAVAVRLPGQTEEVLLKTAEEVRIKPGDRDIRQIRQRVRRLSRAEWRQKRQTDRILHSFTKAKMSTLPIINQIKPGQVSLLPSAFPGKVKKSKAKSSQADDRKVGDRTKQKPDKIGKKLKLKNEVSARGLKPPGKEQRDRDKATASKQDKRDSEKPDSPERVKPAKAEAADRKELRFRNRTDAREN